MKQSSKYYNTFLENPDTLFIYYILKTLWVPSSKFKSSVRALILLQKKHETNINGQILSDVFREKRI